MKVVTAIAPLSMVSWLSCTDPTGVGADGSVMSMICTAPSNAATMAYVEDPIVVVVMPRGLPRASNPVSASDTYATETGLEGSVISIM